MAMHHCGSGIWSQMRFSTGAIFRVTVPATIMRSDCLGLGRKTSAPKQRNVETGSRGCNHLDGAAGQSESEWTESGLPRPVKHVIDQSRHHIALELISGKKDINIL
jgi:hypothetical protein